MNLLKWNMTKVCFFQNLYIIKEDNKILEGNYEK